MKLKEFHIVRYGPLAYKQPVSLGQFNLFYGRNEDGKTLSIDALIRILFGSKVKEFKNIDRVDQAPEGYIILYEVEGEEIKLPEKGNLTTVMGLSQAECSNIFIIRNSDLSISREADFYIGITDRLTGLRTNEIERIKKSLLDIAMVTPLWTFRDVGDIKLKSRIDNAVLLIERIGELGGRMRDEAFDQLVEKMVDCKGEINAIDQEIESYEDARKRQLFEKGNEALEKFKDASKELRGLEQFNREQAQLWRDCERDIERYTRDKENRRVELDEKEKRFEETKKKLDMEAAGVRTLEERKNTLDNDVKPRLVHYEERAKELAGKREKSGFITLALIISSVLCGGSLTGELLRPGYLFAALSILFAASVLVCGIWKLIFLSKEAWLARELSGINLLFAKFSMNAGDIEGIVAAVQMFEEEFSTTTRKLEAVRTEMKILENSIKSLSEEINSSLTEKIEEEKRKIDSIRRLSGVEELGDYEQKVRGKDYYTSSRREQTNLLKGLFGLRDENGNEDDISYWEAKVNELEEYRDRAVHREYDEGKLKQLKENKESLMNELQGIESRMQQFLDELNEVEREANRILKEGTDYLICKTSVDLEAVKSRLAQFVHHCKMNRNNARVVMEIFEEIESEEREKVSMHFGKGRSVSRYFSRITGGAYSEVLFNQERSRVEVKRKEGGILGAEKLSGGAYDQLYLSIRLALGEKLLKEGGGFFILDDPFIKADSGRLRRQFEALIKISRMGWQILYFSAKEEIWELARDKKFRDLIVPIELPGVSS